MPGPALTDAPAATLHSPCAIRNPAPPPAMGRFDLDQSLAAKAIPNKNQNTLIPQSDREACAMTTATPRNSLGERLRATVARLHSHRAANLQPVQRAEPVGHAVPAPARCTYDASLLFGCLPRLQISRDELAHDDPLLFRELQARCSLCRNHDECARDLAQDFPDDRWEAWYDYCPNAATLNALGALQLCTRAARYLPAMTTTTRD
jgi:hypothetical protein